VQATVQHLVTHTAGFGYWIWDADIDHYEQVTGIANVMPGTIDAFQAPMTSDPGTRFGCGINIDWLGQVIEAVSAGSRLTVMSSSTSPGRSAWRTLRRG